MQNKKPIIIIAVLSVLALGLGYWVGLPKDGSDERVEVVAPPAPTVVTNVVTNTLKLVVTNIVTTTPQPTPTPAPVKPQPQPTPTNIVLPYTMNPIVERAVRREIQKPIGELTASDLEKVKALDLRDGGLAEVPKELEKFPQLGRLSFHANKLTDVKGLAKFTKLWHLNLYANQLTDVQGLEKLTKLKTLILKENPDLTKARIEELQKALPNCRILSNPTK
jgi:hypothetical protein